MLSLAIADDKLFSGSYDYTIKVWSLDTLQRLKTLTGQHPQQALTPFITFVSTGCMTVCCEVSAPGPYGIGLR